MSQSRPSYGVKTRKRTARSRHAQHDKQPEETGDSDTVEPACRTREVGRGIDRREWRETSYDGRTRTFFDPCSWCFPDGHPDASDVDTVVKSCRKPTSYHRPRESNEQTCDHGGNPEATLQIEEDPIESVTDLREGQQVIWDNRERPLWVVAATDEPDGAVGLRGPDGGEYIIEGRPEHREPYYVLGDGYRSQITPVRAEKRAGTI
jgi:hypothetical protein